MDIWIPIVKCKHKVIYYEYRCKRKTGFDAAHSETCKTCFSRAETFFLFHFFISHDKKGLKDLAKQISKFNRFNNLVRNMNVENLRMLEEKLNIFEDEIKKIEKEFEFKSFIKNKSKTNVQRKKNLENKKGKLTYPKETEDLSCKKAPKNKLLQMATG